MLVPDKAAFVRLRRTEVVPRDAFLVLCILFGMRRAIFVCPSRRLKRERNAQRKGIQKMTKQNYFQKDIETMPLEEMRKLQSDKLVRQVKHVYENVPYYRDLMDKKGVRPEDIRGIDDLSKLPFIAKADLRDAYPYGLLAKPLEDCVRIHSTSGTTGRRVVAFYTQHDIDLWEDCCARAITAVGGTTIRAGDSAIKVYFTPSAFKSELAINSAPKKRNNAKNIPNTPKITKQNLKTRFAAIKSFFAIRSETSFDTTFGMPIEERARSII